MDRTEKVFVVLVVLAAFSTFSHAKDKWSGNVTAEKDGVAQTHHKLIDGSDYPTESVTNYVVTDKGAHLVLSCTSHIGNKCQTLSAGQTYDTKFDNLKVKVSAKPNGYNLLKPVEFTSTVVDVRQ